MTPAVAGELDAPPVPVGAREPFRELGRSLVAALHLSGLATLTHAPSPMGFLREILDRPENERPFLLLPVGYPAADARVPDLRKKSLDEFTVWV